MILKNHLLFKLHQTGAHKKAIYQRTGGQRDHIWSTRQWQNKTGDGNYIQLFLWRDCQPHPFFCAACDVHMNTRHPLHKRGFFQPLPPSTVIQNDVFCPCGKFWFVSTKYVFVGLVEHMLKIMSLHSRYIYVCLSVKRDLYE